MIELTAVSLISIFVPRSISATLPYDFTEPFTVATVELEPTLATVSVLLVTFESRPSIEICTGPFSEPDFNFSAKILNETTSPLFNFADGANSNSTESSYTDINSVIFAFVAFITVLSASVVSGFLSHPAFFKLNLIV